MIVYIASPYSGYANKADAVSVQVDKFAELRDLGYSPIAPLLSHYVDERHPASYERWLQWCLAMVGVSDVVLRLPGDSDGADREVAEARRLGKPVVYSIDAIAPYKFIYAGELHRYDFIIDKSQNPGTVNEAAGDAPYTWAEFQAANQAAKDDIAAFVGGKSE